MTTAAQAAAGDAAAIRAGVPSRALMQRAGAAAAAELALRYPFQLESGVLVFAGPGNNGGDAWVLARALAATGMRVRVAEPVPATTEDARAERALAEPFVEVISQTDASAPRLVASGERVVIDGLLGTGASGHPRGAAAAAIGTIADLRARGSIVVALDVPSGVDASSGDAGRAVTADLTLTFGTVKRGLLVARDHCGVIVVLDIGLAGHADVDGTLGMVDARWVAGVLPPIAAAAHKGTRKRVAIVGGAEGMAGAAVLAARAAARSGVGMVKLVVAPESVRAVQEAEAAAMAACWPADDAAVRHDVAEWADVIAIGPGLGRGPEARSLVEHVLRASRGPVVIDADGLNAFSGDVAALARLIGERATLLTPHAVEFARLSGIELEAVLASRFDVGATLAARCGAAVLLKGVPTVVSAPDGRRLVSASGSPVLATAGSGDVLTGIAATLLAQIGDPLAAGAAAAWVHGRAAELAQGTPDAARGTTRGITLDDVLAALPRYPVLLELPAVGDTSAAAGRGRV